MTISIFLQDADHLTLLKKEVAMTSSDNTPEIDISTVNVSEPVHTIELSNQDFKLSINGLTRKQLEYIAHRIMVHLGGYIAYPLSPEDIAYGREGGHNV